ncbi:MAG TPA: HAD-IA family hydrolase [Burkholderiaceae bacterium]|jgi:putative hydrolase of the HAD superfamily|nr:HAD-IA family hydrolase [Burkholderiaceae bacterium]
MNLDRAGRAIVFDFGRVLFRWRPEAVVEQALQHRLDANRDVAHWVAEIFQAYEGDWQDFDRGTVDVPNLVRRIAVRTGLSEADVLAVVEAAPDELQPLPDTVAWLRRLHAQGRPLHFLSNMPAPFAEVLEESHDFMAHFESGVFSARVQAVKPEPEIFERAAQTFGRPPSSLLLVDDLLPNIVAARAAGWHGVQFIDAKQAEAEVVALGW